MRVAAACVAQPEQAAKDPGRRRVLRLLCTTRIWVVLHEDRQDGMARRSRLTWTKVESFSLLSVEGTRCMAGSFSTGRAPKTGRKSRASPLTFAPIVRRTRCFDLPRTGDRTTTCATASRHGRLRRSVGHTRRSRRRVRRRGTALVGCPVWSPWPPAATSGDASGCRIVARAPARHRRYRWRGLTRRARACHGSSEVTSKDSTSSNGLRVGTTFAVDTPHWTTSAQSPTKPPPTPPHRPSK